jgi:DNA-binding transcriptional ArsR family regulator
MKRRIDPWPSRMCGLLASDLRRALLVALGSGPLDVTTLSKQSGAEVSLVSRNLGVLHEEGLVEIERDARRRVYSLSKRVQLRPRDGGKSTALRIAGTNGHIIQITQPRVRGSK